MDFVIYRKFDAIQRNLLKITVIHFNLTWNSTEFYPNFREMLLKGHQSSNLFRLGYLLQKR